MTPQLEASLLDLKARFMRTLPARVAAIAESLRQRQDGSGVGESTLDRQFHTLAGTAGTFGLLAIAATACEGSDECSNGGAIDADARYLWSLIDDLAYEATFPPQEPLPVTGSNR